MARVEKCYNKGCNKGIQITNKVYYPLSDYRNHRVCSSKCSEALNEEVKKFIELSLEKKEEEKVKDHYLLQFFEYDHLPEKLKIKSIPFHDLAKIVVETVPSNPEQTTCLRKLLEAKDCAVRAMIFKKENKNGNS